MVVFDRDHLHTVAGQDRRVLRRGQEKEIVVPLLGRYLVFVRKDALEIRDSQRIRLKNGMDVPEDEIGVVVLFLQLAGKDRFAGILDIPADGDVPHRGDGQDHAAVVQAQHLSRLLDHRFGVGRVLVSAAQKRVVHMDLSLVCQGGHGQDDEYCRNDTGEKPSQVHLSLRCSF